MKTVAINWPHEYRTLAVMFRTGSPNCCHVSSFDVLEHAALLYAYGLWRGTPARHRRERRRIAESMASNLERKADILEGKKALVIAPDNPRNL